MKIPIFYRPEQNAPSTDSFSPSASKPALVVQDWLGDEKIAPSLDVRTFWPATVSNIALAHSHKYVNGVLKGNLDNGFGNKDPAVAKSLPYTVGSIMAAATHVLTVRPETRFNVAVSPTSGFHHAGHSAGGGFCTFNGLMVAAIRAYQLGLAKRILILDFDQHYGNGTENIIQTLGIDYITHITAIKSYNSASEAFEQIANHLVWGKTKYDLCLFQAGADIHVDDPLGGIMTTSEIKARDRMVFERCLLRGIPLVWNLAGGYQRGPDGGIEPVLALHRQTMLECIKALSLSC